MHCFDCLSFQAISRSTLKLRSSQREWCHEYISRAVLPDALQKASSLDSRSGAPSQSIFQGTETDTVLSVCIIFAPHPSASRCSRTASERPARAHSTSPSTCVRWAAAARQFASDCFPFSLSEFKLGRRRRPGRRRWVRGGK